MAEDPFVETALRAAQEVVAPPLSVRRGAVLLYEVTVDNRLHVRVDPKKPVRGRSAFQTDLCVFEAVEPGVEIPRVVMEFKTGLTTHDVLTYSAKARRHKQIYPYLRYGVVASSESRVPGRFFRHNEALDYCLAVAPYKDGHLHALLAEMFRDEVAASRQLEEIAFGTIGAQVYRSAVVLRRGPAWAESATDPTLAAARDVLRMVAALHRRGYQRLRIAPGMSPSGTSWRCAVAPAVNTLRAHGARLDAWDGLAAHHTSGMGRRYFGWEDAEDAPPDVLADLFLKRFPDVAAAGRGTDWPYAGWFEAMMQATEPDAFPIAYADYPVDEHRLSTVGGRAADGRTVPLPPPGEADGADPARAAVRAADV